MVGGSLAGTTVPSMWSRKMTGIHYHHTLLLRGNSQRQDLLGLGFGTRLPPDSNGAGGHSEDRHNYSVWPVRIFEDALWPQKFGTGLPTLDGRYPPGPPVGFRVLGRHLSCLLYTSPSPRDS